MNYFKKLNFRLLTLCLIAFAICIFISNFLVAEVWNKNEIFRQLLLSILLAIQSGTLATALWEILAKKNFASEVFKLAQISKNIEDAGIEYFYKS